MDEKARYDFPEDDQLPEPTTSQVLNDDEYGDGEDEFGSEWESDEDDSRFVDFSLLSHIAVRLRDKVARETHVKGSIPYPRAFTGKDIVVSTPMNLSS